MAGRHQRLPRQVDALHQLDIRAIFEQQIGLTWLNAMNEQRRDGGANVGFVAKVPRVPFLRAEHANHARLARLFGKPLHERQEFFRE